MPLFVSNDRSFIWMNGIQIFNNRDKYDDEAYLYKSNWSGIVVGTDEYPAYHEDGDLYCISGREFSRFKATAIEFYQVKTKI